MVWADPIATFPYYKGLVPVVVSWFLAPLSAMAVAAATFLTNRWGVGNPVGGGRGGPQGGSEGPLSAMHGGDGGYLFDKQVGRGRGEGTRGGQAHLWEGAVQGEGQCRVVGVGR